MGKRHLIIDPRYQLFERIPKLSLPRGRGSHSSYRVQSSGSGKPTPAARILHCTLAVAVKLFFSGCPPSAPEAATPNAIPDRNRHRAFRTT